MTLRKTALALGIALTAMFVVAAHAQQTETNNKTILTFDQPVEVPGMVLPAGSYTFQLMDTPSTDHHIVQIFDKGGSKLITTVLAVNESRTAATDKTVTTFYEVPAGKPQALHVWYYPGRTVGQGFVYPKTRATELEAAGNTHVNAAEDAELQAQLQTKTPVMAQTTTTKPQTPVVQSTTTPVQQQTTTMKPTTPVQPTTPVPAPTTPTRDELPHTAGSAPNAILMGILAMAMGAALSRVGRKQSV
jgi:hypothetical protein